MIYLHAIDTLRSDRAEITNLKRRSELYMGTSGESILADDDAQEIYEQYRRMFLQGKERAEVQRLLVNSWAESISDVDDGAVFWLAVAQAQWEFGGVEDDVRTRVQEVVTKGLGLDRWREGGPEMLAKREKAIRQFAAKICSPNPKPIKQRIEKRHPPIYLPGDCLSIALLDGTFGAVLVIACDDTHHTEGFDVVALLEWHATKMPPVELFERLVLISPPEDGRLIPVVRRCYARSHPTTKKKLHQVGQLTRQKTTAISKKTGFMGRWQEVVTDLEHYYCLRT